MAKSLEFSIFPPNRPLEENAIPVVFLHGWGLNSAVWQPLLTLFANNQTNYQFITIDLPGFGNNNDIELKPYSLTNICQQINQIIEQPAIYIGWSLGGLVATEMALQHPKQVLALATVASSPYFVDQPINQWPGIKEHILKNFHQQLATDAAKTINGFLKIQAMGSPHIRQDLKLITQLVMAYPLASQQTLDDSLSLLSDCDLRSNLVQIKQPFLRLYGRNDSLVPKAVIDKVSNLAPNSSHHIFEHASHAPFISHLDDFYQVLLSWLKSQH
ncbi:pimeloyl-ACP methyl ester esterase BioH [Colwellia echini]|uniref:Pimeloyl-[acyl-carrier protein] methyl ester esterase n=1 Tax=Colwellia echini TaxID=1982103 RepID=A0ABY3MZE1_9GAMM|nr:pimeloyl-ACP methyl ester esterase BioH [Colwellia echini]TYK66578.1 pimeloyl-ACP methyl ester esterase BioH [Colwellia echini]